jgi:hypothetical protein
MQGKTRKGHTYYACGYRAAYGDNAAEALGHGKWQYIREDRLTDLIDQFFRTYIFGPNATTHFRAQHAALASTLGDEQSETRVRLTDRLSDLDRRIARQITAIESGVDPVLVGERIRALKGERKECELAVVRRDAEQHQHTIIDLDEACAMFDALPDLSAPLAKADPELRHRVFEAFHFSVELDRNKPEIRMKALVSSAFGSAGDLDSIAAKVTDKTIAGERFDPICDLWSLEQIALSWPG